MGHGLVTVWSRVEFVTIFYHRHGDMRQSLNNMNDDSMQGIVQSFHEATCEIHATIAQHSVVVLKLESKTVSVFDTIPHVKASTPMHIGMLPSPW